MFVFALFGFNELQIMSFGVNHLPNTRLFSAMSPLHHTLHSPPSTLQLSPILLFAILFCHHFQIVYFSRIAFDDLLFFLPTANAIVDATY